jgi:hypothetical protein
MDATKAGIHFNLQLRGRLMLMLGSYLDRDQ